MKKVKIIGDHSKTHCGCKAVIGYLKHLLKGKYEIVDDLSYDILLVNGEGSMHHGSPNFKKKMDAIKVALVEGKQVRLVNTVWEDNPASYDSVLKEIPHIVVREAASHQDLLLRHGIDSTVRIDSSYFCPLAEKPEFTDLGGAASVTDFYSEEYDGWVKVTAGKLAQNRYLDMRKFSWSGFVKTLSTSKLLVTGRHHAVFAACRAKVPFVALESNTHKISGFVKMAGIPIPVCTEPSQLPRAIDWANRNPGAYREFFSFLDAQPKFLLEDIGL